MKVRYTRTRSLGAFRGGFHSPGEAPALTEQKIVELPDGIACPEDAEEISADTPVSDWTEVVPNGGTE